MVESGQGSLAVKKALLAAKASSGTLEDRICAFLRTLSLPVPQELSQFGHYNLQLLAAEIERIVHADDVTES